MAIVGTRHLGLKFVSVVLAALLWLLVAGEQTVERALRIPLEFSNLPAQLEFVGEPPTVVDVRVRGSSGALSRVAPGELAAVLDVRAARAGQRLFNLSASDVRAPFGVEIVQVMPTSIQLEFEESLSRTVGVTARVEGQPAAGFSVGGVTVEPPTAEVVGPATALKGLSEAITEPVSIAGASGPVTETVTIGVADPRVRLRQPQTARVTVSIGAVPTEWVVPGVPVQVQDGLAKARVSPDRVSLRVRGPRDAMDTEPGHYRATVDATGLAAGRHVMPVRVEPPPGLGLLRIDPAEVVVTVR